MYTLYLDESGDWGYPKYNVNKPILCLCGCIFRDEYYTKNALPNIKSIKRKFFHKDVILHRYKLKNRVNDFKVLKTQENTDKCIKQISQTIAEMDCQILLSAINKEDYYKTYGITRVDPYLPEDIYSIVFTFAVERFVLFLRERKSTGKIVAESRGKKEDQTIQYWYSLLLHNGTKFLVDWQFRDVLLNAVEFRKKEENIIGLQIADWIAHPMAKIIQFADGSEDQYNEWSLYKDKIWLGQNAPANGQVGFKVFPKNLGRVLLEMPIKSVKDSN